MIEDIVHICWCDIRIKKLQESNYRLLDIEKTFLNNMNMKNKNLVVVCSLAFMMGCTVNKPTTKVPGSISGIYPNLAYYNNEGECGTGAVVPWNDRLWVITYGPHLPNGSSDKLYEVTPDYSQIVHGESVGGTSANRMIHRESNQLFIGPYAIDSAGGVRVIPYEKMPGRHTGNARHLTDPAHKIYYGTMEEGFYEVDVNSLAVKELYRDGNNLPQKWDKDQAGPLNSMLPGVHGKGLYSGQGVMVYSNNGEGTQEALRKFDVEAGVLAEWNGKEWKVVRRNQFTEITGPGGIYGNRNAETDPLWALGWDHKSVILGTRDVRQGWTFYRLPKASHSYDGAHGWNTEWPRIRNVGTEQDPDFLMTMHGMFWNFPASFCTGNTAGVRPRSAYLKVIGDFARWQERLVFGCDDTAQKEFLNTRKVKGNIGGPGQSNSNLWFTSFDTPDNLGPATAVGTVWSKETIEPGQPSEPFLFAGWDFRRCWIKNEGKRPVIFSFEVDKQGNGNWSLLKTVTVDADKAASIVFSVSDKGEWVRVKTDKLTRGTVAFTYTESDRRGTQPADIYKGMTPIESKITIGGILYSLGDNRRSMGLLATKMKNGEVLETGYYEMDDNLRLIHKNDTLTTALMRDKFAIDSRGIQIESGSVLVIDDAGRRWRLPLGNARCEKLTQDGMLRLCREVATERDLFSCMGTFYELPAENADGYAKIRPIATHPYIVNDYASYRGMLLMTGISPDKAKNNPHIIVSDDGKAAVWCGVIDDLWKLGKPVGQGGPWKNEQVKAGIPSDPYLIGYYDRKSLSLSHSSPVTVNFTLEVDPTGNGDWMTYLTCKVNEGEKWNHQFPKDFSARWIRFLSDVDTKASAWLVYE